MTDWDRREYDRERHARQKAECIAYLGGVCVKCGTSERLEFDHIDPATKSFSIMRFNRKLEDLREELDKCQLLCKDCHFTKTVQDLGVPHGGGLSGRRNCPCELCKATKREYMRQYKRTRRVKAGARSPAA